MTLFRLVRAVVLSVFRVLFRVKLYGTEKVPATGAYILAPSHRSLLDTPFLSYVTKRQLFFLAKEELFHNRIIARMLRKFGGVPVARGTPDRAALRVMSEKLLAGEPVAIFPEGTRRHGPDVAELFDGAAYLALKRNVSIVPVGIGGSEEILPSGKSLPRLKRVVIIVGDPIVAPHHEGSVKRREVLEITSELHGAIQKLYTEASGLAEHGSR